MCTSRFRPHCGTAACAVATLAKSLTLLWTTRGFPHLGSATPPLRQPSITGPRSPRCPSPAACVADGRLPPGPG
eukprot:351117-Chlamydomonas_euryale.AAC.2